MHDLCRIFCLFRSLITSRVTNNRHNRKNILSFPINYNYNNNYYWIKLEHYNSWIKELTIPIYSFNKSKQIYFKFISFNEHVRISRFSSQSIKIFIKKLCKRKDTNEEKKLQKVHSNTFYSWARSLTVKARDVFHIEFLMFFEPLVTLRIHSFSSLFLFF